MGASCSSDGDAPVEPSRPPATRNIITTPHGGISDVGGTSDDRSTMTSPRDGTNSPPTKKKKTKKVTVVKKTIVRRVKKEKKDGPADAAAPAESAPNNPLGAPTPPSDINFLTFGPAPALAGDDAMDPDFGRMEVSEGVLSERTSRRGSAPVSPTTAAR